MSVSTEEVNRSKLIKNEHQKKKEVKENIRTPSAGVRSLLSTGEDEGTRWRDGHSQKVVKRNATIGKKKA